MRWLTSLPPVMDAVSESATVKPNSNASTPPLVVDLIPWWTRVQLAVSHGGSENPPSTFKPVSHWGKENLTLNCVGLQRICLHVFWCWCDELVANQKQSSSHGAIMVVITETNTVVRLAKRWTKQCTPFDLFVAYVLHLIPTRLGLAELHSWAPSMLGKI